MRQPTLLQLALSDEGLLAPLQLVEVIRYAGEEGVDFGADFGEEGGLGGVQVGLGD